MSRKILIVGREIPYTLTNHLMEYGIELNFVRQIRKECFREMTQSFEPQSIIFMEMSTEIDVRQRAHMILEMGKMPILVTGNFTWSDYIVIRAPHVYFASIVTPEDALTWFKCACQ